MDSREWTGTESSGKAKRSRGFKMEVADQDGSDQGELDTFYLVSVGGLYLY